MLGPSVQDPRTDRTVENFRKRNLHAQEQHVDLGADLLEARSNANNVEHSGSVCDLLWCVAWVVGVLEEETKEICSQFLAVNTTAPAQSDTHRIPRVV